MKRELEEMSELPSQDESLFSKLSVSPTQAQFSIWKRNLFVPLSDQLEEQAKRKMAEIEEKKLREAEADLVFRQVEDDEGLHDIDAVEKKNKRHQAILKQHFAQEMKDKGLDAPDVERVKAEHEERENRRVTDSIDSMPVKKKKSWRVW